MAGNEGRMTDVSRARSHLRDAVLLPLAIEIGGFQPLELQLLDRSKYERYVSVVIRRAKRVTGLCVKKMKKSVMSH